MIRDGLKKESGTSLPCEINPAFCHDIGAQPVEE
jgi:hypothetical protein